MDTICRLCCSTHFVNNYIFDEKNALFFKMSLYLPIKVFKNDRLPQKICDKCSCKVNDFYQFCNKTIEVQNRLNSILISSKIDDNERLDFTKLKTNPSFPPCPKTCSQSTQTEPEDQIASVPIIRTEPKILTLEIEKECDYFDGDDFPHTDIPSDNSEDELLIDIKKKKKSKKEDSVTSNGVVKAKRGGKRKTKPNDDEVLSSQALGNGLTIINEESVDLDFVSEEIELRPQEGGKVLDSINALKGKAESNEETFFCCMCFAQCSSQQALLKHYKEHGRTAKKTPAPPPPPRPAGDSPRCMRCQKVVPATKWARHWRRHFARDTHPYRCALCEVTYRAHASIMKHGLTHSAQELRRKDDKRAALLCYVCDVCPERFDYMRSLLAHRTRAHPEVSLRCHVCARNFAHTKTLRRHMRVHSGKLNFQCNVCGKTLSSRDHLKLHVRIHTGYKPNICKTCGKGFAKKCNLKLHERVHSGEKPYVCSDCGRAFSQSSTLVIHERSHSGARPFSCSLCGRGFVARGLLTMHQKTACVDLPRPRRTLRSSARSN